MFDAVGVYAKLLERVTAFLPPYSEQVSANAPKLRDVLLKNPPGVHEQLVVPARMITTRL